MTPATARYSSHRRHTEHTFDPKTRPGAPQDPRLKCRFGQRRNAVKVPKGIPLIIGTTVVPEPRSVRSDRRHRNGVRLRANQHQILRRVTPYRRSPAVDAASRIEVDQCETVFDKRPDDRRVIIQHADAGETPATKPATAPTPNIVISFNPFKLISVSRVNLITNSGISDVAGAQLSIIIEYRVEPKVFHS